MEYGWPGNVRELKNVVERLIIRAGGRPIQMADLPADVLRVASTAAQAAAATPARPAAKSVPDELFDKMVNERQSFWSVVYGPFMSRDLTRADIRALVKRGLESTSGNYKVLVELFNMKPDDYKRFLGFLRKYHCHMPFQQFRSAAASRPQQADDNPEKAAANA
jgi:DNA-binding NtrC family response regulator